MVPAALRKDMGLEVGDEVLMGLEDGEARLYTRAHAVRRAQELVRQHVPEGQSLVDDLLEERRREVEEEEAEPVTAGRAKRGAAE